MTTCGLHQVARMGVDKHTILHSKFQEFIQNLCPQSVTFLEATGRLSHDDDFS
jgi:hypothetical protein